MSVNKPGSTRLPSHPKQWRKAVCSSATSSEWQKKPPTPLLFFFPYDLLSSNSCHINRRRPFRGSVFFAVTLWGRAVTRMRPVQRPPIMHYNWEKIAWVGTYLESGERGIFLSSANWDVLGTYETLKNNPFS